MNDKKNFSLSLLIFICTPISIVVGAIVTQITDNNRIQALGGLLILIPLTVLCFWGVYLISHKEKKQKEEQELAKKLAREKQISDALSAFENKTELPKTNTVKLVENGLEFEAEGIYFCKKDFKNIRGNHFAFEVRTTALKYKPSDYEDICDLESVGIFVEVGYHDGEALEEYANDNGVILDDTVQNTVGKTIAIAPDKGYVARITTVEHDDMDYGFAKILKCENDVLTLYFSLTNSFGLCDTVEGVVELNKEPSEDDYDIKSLITKVKWRGYNLLNVSADQAQAIKQNNPFLPESYITFLREVGFADLDWIDVGWDNNTPTNLRDDETEDMKNLLTKCGGNFALDDLYFFAISSDGTYYAFSKDPNDEKVYMFSEDLPDGPPSDSFEHFLKEILWA